VRCAARSDVTAWLQLLGREAPIVVDRRPLTSYVLLRLLRTTILPWVMQRAWRGAPYLARSRSLSRSAQEFIYPRAAELSKSQSAAVGLRITKCFALLSYLQFICIRTKGIVFAHDERFTSRKKHPFIHSCGRFRLILLHV
jgi:hypothetical protein